MSIPIFPMLFVGVSMLKNNVLQTVIKTVLVSLIVVSISLSLIPGLIAIACLILYEAV